jgi:CheY-like chemotaxis protein
MAPFRTLIVEEHEGLLALLRSLLENDTQCVVVGEASDGLQAVQTAQELQPDLILLDLSLPKLNGIEAGRRIRKISPQSKIVFLSQNPTGCVAQPDHRALVKWIQYGATRSCHHRHDEQARSCIHPPFCGALFRAIQARVSASARADRPRHVHTYPRRRLRTFARYGLRHRAT